MTKQITVKLNYELFRPILDMMNKFAGEAMANSDSDMVGKCIFENYRNMIVKRADLGNRTVFDIIAEQSNLEKPELLLNFLNDYHHFKKNGLKK